MKAIFAIKYKGYYFLLVILGLCQPAFAQLSETDTMRWQYNLRATGSLTTGNVERLLLINKGELKHRTDRLGMITSNTYRAGTIRGNKTEDDIISKNYCYLGPDRRVYPYQLTWLERNWRRKINFRYQVGLGVSFVPIKEDGDLFKISLTAIHEKTWFRGSNFQHEPESEASKIQSWRGRIRIFGRHDLFNQKAKLHYELWGQQSPFKRYDYRYYLETTLSIPLYKKFAFRMALNYLYENIALETAKKHDLFLTFGASWGN